MPLLTWPVALASTGISFLLSYRRLRQRRLSFIVYASVWMFFGLPELLRPVALHFGAQVRAMGIVPARVPAATVVESNLLILVSVIFLFLGESTATLYLRRPVRLPRRDPSVLLWENATVYRWTSNIMLPLAALGTLLLFWSRSLDITSLTALASSAARLSRIPTKSWVVGVLGGNMAFFVMPATYAVLMLRRKVMLLGCVVVTLLLIVASGTRSYLLLVLGPVAYLWLKRANPPVKTLAILCVAPFVIAYASECVRQWRWQPERSLGALADVAISPNTLSALVEDPAAESNIYDFSLNAAVYLYPRSRDWLYGRTYANILMMPIPREIVGRAKELSIQEFADAIYGTDSSYLERQSAHPTFIGDSYINFGWLFWIAIFWWGVVFVIMDPPRPSRLLELTVGSTGVLFLMYFVRGSIYLAVWVLVFVTAGTVLSLAVRRLAIGRPHTAEGFRATSDHAFS